MKARQSIKLKHNSDRPGLHGLIEDEATYEGVKEGRLNWEKTKRITHYVIPQSVFMRLLELDKASEKMCGHWEEFKIRNEMYGCMYKCSCCGEMRTSKTNFCPDCGADLREPEEYDPEDPNKPEAVQV